MMPADPGLHPDVSVVVPCFNEAENAGPIAAAITTQIEQAGVTFDLIFIDNASTDRTVEIIRGLCAADPRIRLIINTRNFGQMRSPTHGIFEARGRAVIGMCADFQDPPELLGQFIERWRAGVDVILGVRKSEDTSLLLGLFRRAFYASSRMIGDYPIIRNATGFGLYDAKVVRAIAAMNEPEPFFRGMLVETGYRIETIAYERPRRQRGLSKNNFFTLVDFALSGLISSSKTLLRLPLLAGIMTGVLALFSLLAAPVALLAGESPAGWLLAAAIEGQFALLFIFLGLIGEQLRRVSDRTRQTPLVMERERINFPPDY